MTVSECCLIKLLPYILFEQVIARRDDLPPPIAADLRPCADGSAVRTALVASYAVRAAPRPDRQAGTDSQIDGSRHRLMPPISGGI